MNKFPFMRLMILNFLIKQDGLTGYDIIKYCRSNGIPASSGNVYPQLKTLEDTRFISCVEEGRRKLYRMTAYGREQVECTSIADAPEFLKSVFFKSMWLASRIDWKKREDLRMLLDNVGEISRFLTEYMEKI